MRDPIKLNQQNLPHIPPSIPTPGYNRRLLNRAIVHIGVGGFHRAHQAMYLDALLAMPETERWGECGVGLLEGDQRMHEVMLGQDCLYTLVERGQSGETARIIGSIREYLFAPQDREAVLARIADEETRIVSLTITEGGYFFDSGTGRINLDHPEIRHDLEHPHQPYTCVGFLAEALDRRKRAGLPPFTVMCCDNLQGNGDVTRELLIAFTGMRDSTLQRYVEQSVCFPNSMVDRITPGTTPQDLTFVKDEFGIEDAWPVMTEPYKQWVVEDNFSLGRPAWEKVGATIVADVVPYELMKIRLLNGSHLAMGYLGALAGYKLVHEVIADELFVRFIQSFMEEVTPAVPRIAGVSLEQYKASLIERFANPAINDQVTRICSEGSAKLPKWILPSFLDLLKHGEPTRLLCVVLASWIFYLRQGVDETGQALTIVDARSAELTKIAREGGLEPAAMLSVTSIFGPVLPNHSNTVSKIKEVMERLSKAGARGTIASYLNASATD